MCAVVNIALARRRYGYKVRDLLRAVRFSRDLFRKTRSLAFSSLLTVVAWIVFYELDPFAIGKLLGAQFLAVYAIALSAMSFVRNLLGILYNPFSARFNHFIGVGDIEGLKRFYRRVVELTMPATILPLLCLELLLQPFILSWVGPAYAASVPLAGLLLSSYACSFVSYPGGMLLVAQKRVRIINVLSAGEALVFWLGVIATIRPLGLYAFPAQRP